MEDAEDRRVANLLAATSLAVEDRVRSATETAAGRGAAAPAALASLHQFLSGGSVDELRQVTGLTHSGAVRLIDRLEQDGLLKRVAGRDARSVSVVLTPAGRRATRRMLEARRRAVTELTGTLTTREQATLAGLLEKLIARETTNRLAARESGDPPAGWLCRLCDMTACGRADGRCPAVETATRRPPPT